MNNLWVRSQDKKMLIPIKEMLIQSSNCIIYQGNIIGGYKTEKRALEILDTIQKILTPTIINTSIVKEAIKPQSVNRTFEQIGDNIEIRELNTFVFEMPKE